MCERDMLALVADMENPAVSLFAGCGKEGYVNGKVSKARFKGIDGIAVDTVGNILIADSFNNCIRKISVNGIVSTIAGDGEEGFQDGPGSTARFSCPTAIALDSEGNIIVCDQDNHCIRKVTIDGTVSTVAGMAGNEGYRDGPSHSAKFSPSGVAVDGDGNIFVSDCGNHCIRKITREGIVSTLAGKKKRGFRDGQGSLARFKCPKGIALDMNGNILVCDPKDNRIRKITPSGEVTTLAGNGNPGSEAGIRDACLNSPESLAVDGDNNVIVANYEDSRILKISNEGLLSEIVCGTDGSTDDSFFEPIVVAIDGEGNILVSGVNGNNLYSVAANLTPPQKGPNSSHVHMARTVCMHKSNSDVDIHVGDKVFPAHRMVLAQSPFFEACFTEEFCENTDGKIVLKDVNQAAFELVLEYLYTEKWSIPSHCNLMELRSAAEFLMLSPLQKICETEIQKSLCSDNLVKFFRYAKTNSMNGLKRQCIEFASSSAAELARVVLSKDFIKMFQEDAELSKTFLEACEANGE